MEKYFPRFNVSSQHRNQRVLETQLNAVLTADLRSLSESPGERDVLSQKVSASLLVSNLKSRIWRAANGLGSVSRQRSLVVSVEWLAGLPQTEYSTRRVCFARWLPLAGAWFS
jgi:hypothetical protein